MKKVILDTNFILTCVKQKIDFFEYLEIQGFRILIPKEVIGEIENIAKSNKKLRFKGDAKLALKLLKKNKFNKIFIDSKNVDIGIIDFAKDDSEIIIGTLDARIKKKAKNQKLVIREKKRLEII